jgi:hypothetical protein
LPPTSLRRLGFAILACGVLAELLVRGPVRGLRDSQDLGVHFAAARVWVEGGDPYRAADLADAFRRGGGPDRLSPTEAWMPSVYPPATYALEAPLALLDWPAAVVVVQLLSIGLVAAALASLARAASLPPARASAFAVAALALAPLHTGLAMGQVAVASGALLILGWALKRERPALAGLLVALGTALKPSLALPIVLAGLAGPSRRWALSAGGSLLALAAAGELRLALAGHEGIRSWIRNVLLAAGPGGMNSASPENPLTITIVGWEVLLQRWFPASARPLAGAAAIALAIPLALMALRRVREAASVGAELLPVSLLCVVGLLASYHRVYDAVLLWFPMAACARDWSGLRRPARLLAAATFVAFLVPGPVALDLLARAGRVPAAAAGSAAWQLVVLPHQIWILSAVALGLARLLPPAERRAQPDLERRGLPRVG